MCWVQGCTARCISFSQWISYNIAVLQINSCLTCEIFILSSILCSVYFLKLIWCTCCNVYDVGMSCRPAIMFVQLYVRILIFFSFLSIIPLINCYLIQLFFHFKGQIIEFNLKFDIWNFNFWNIITIDWNKYYIFHLFISSSYFGSLILFCQNLIIFYIIILHIYCWKFCIL